MQQKMIVRSSQGMLSFMLLFFPLLSQGTAAYIPQMLRECINVVGEIAESATDTRNLQELHAMIKENRILTSDDMMRKAVEETLDVMKQYKNKLQDNNQYSSVKGYLKEYLNSLDEVSVLLAMKGKDAYAMSWPLSLVTRCLADCSVGKDMIHLSSELAATNNIELCGNVEIAHNNVNMRAVANVMKPTRAASTVYFNANSMTNSMLTTPNVIFGTGITSPSINAWSMLASNMVQSPINMQFPVPRKLNKNKPVALELYFLVSNHGGVGGLANVMVDVEYLQENGSFNISNAVPTFTSIATSGNFAITEPTDLNSVQCVSVTIPLATAGLRMSTFILLSVTRIAPTSGTEYAQDIYLSAANFRYVTK